MPIINMPEYREMFLKIDPRKLDDVNREVIGTFINDLPEGFLDDLSKELFSENDGLLLNRRRLSETKDIGYIVRLLYLYFSECSVLDQSMNVLINKPSSDMHGISIFRDISIMDSLDFNYTSCEGYVDDLIDKNIENKYNIGFDEHKVERITQLFPHVKYVHCKNSHNYIVFEIWHPQRPYVSNVYVDIEHRLIFLSTKYFQSLGRDYKQSLLWLISKFYLDSLPYLKSKNEPSEKKQLKCSKAEEIDIFIFSSPHFGHYVMNTLGQLARLDYLFDRRDSQSFELVNIFIDELPDWLSLEDIQHYVRSQNIKIHIGREKCVDRVSMSNDIIVPFGGYLLPPDFPSRTQDFINSKENSKLSVVRKNDTLIKICFGFRFGSRELIDQIDFYEKIVRILATAYTVHIVFDGMFNSNSQNHSTTKKLDGGRELSAYNEFNEKIGDLLNDKVFTTSVVNIELKEQLRAISDCHIVIAPLGSGFAKYLWFLDLPGIAFGSKEAIRSFEQKTNGKNGVGLNFNIPTCNLYRNKQHILNNCVITAEDCTSIGYRDSFLIDSQKATLQKFDIMEQELNFFQQKKLIFKKC